MVFSGHIKKFIAISLILYSFASAIKVGNGTCKLSFPSESFGVNPNQWNYNNIDSWKSNSSLILIRSYYEHLFWIKLVPNQYNYLGFKVSWLKNLNSLVSTEICGHDRLKYPLKIKIYIEMHTLEMKGDVLRINLLDPSGI